MAGVGSRMDGGVGGTGGCCLVISGGQDTAGGAVGSTSDPGGGDTGLGCECTEPGGINGGEVDGGLGL